MPLRPLHFCLAVVAASCGSAVQADPLSEAISACLAAHPGPQQSAARLECYAAAESKAAAAEAPAPVAGAGDAGPSGSASPGGAPSHLDALWRSDSPLSLKLHRQNYLLMTHTGRPNEAPRSGNPLNNVPHTFDLKQNEAKFQLSLKALVVDEKEFAPLGCGNSVWLGYTQQSHWQIADVDRSRPFRESNYEPEMIFSHRIEPCSRLGALLPEPLGFVPRVLNVGLVHQSNGQSLPRSRSWNRAYAQLGMERPAGDGSVAILVRPWVRLGDRVSGSDDNPDIGHFLGHGEVEMLYWGEKYLFSVLGRRRSAQFDLSVPLDSGNKSVQLHFQYFTGYGESLIDYSQRHTTWGLGLSLPYR